MKNLKYTIFLLLQVFALQLVIGQSQTDNNGRPLGTTPDKPIVVDQPVLKSGDNLTEIDDADIPGTYFLHSGQDDVIVGDESPADLLLKRLENLETELNELRVYNEQLAKENENIKMEMSNCCSEAASNLNLASSYLLQNSPNPYTDDTKVQFFISDSADDAVLEVRNIDGVLLKSFDLDQRGLGELRLDSKTYAKGTFVYTLSVDGKIIDSKVMIRQ